RSGTHIQFRGTRAETQERIAPQASTSAPAALPEQQNSFFSYSKSQGQSCNTGSLQQRSLQNVVHSVGVEGHGDISTAAHHQFVGCDIAQHVRRISRTALQLEKCLVPSRRESATRASSARVAVVEVQIPRQDQASTSLHAGLTIQVSVAAILKHEQPSD